MTWRRVLESVLVLAAVSVSTACQGGVEPPAAVPSPRAAAFLGPEVAAILSQPDRVETYLLESALAPDAIGPGSVAGYLWKARGTPLERADVAALRSLAFSDTSYDFENAKKCPLVPEYDVRFIKGDAAVDVLFSFQCTMWEFVHKNVRKREDFDPVQDQIKRILGTVFRVP